MSASNPFSSFMKKWDGQTVGSEQLKKETDKKLKILAAKRDEEDGEDGAHKHSIFNRDEIKDSKLCGCFSCLCIFPPSAIIDWCDAEDKTAICPKCGIDAVYGDASGYKVTPEFLSELKKIWF